MPVKTKVDKMGGLHQALPQVTGLERLNGTCARSRGMDKLWEGVLLWSVMAGFIQLMAFLLGLSVFTSRFHDFTIYGKLNLHANECELRGLLRPW